MWTSAIGTILFDVRAGAEDGRGEAFTSPLAEIDSAKPPRLTWKKITVQTAADNWPALTGNTDPTVYHAPEAAGAYRID
jgi:hypothetical protein